MIQCELLHYRTRVFCYPTVQNWWIILPDSNARRLWEVWMLAPMLYVAFITPFRIFFNDEATVRKSDYLQNLSL